MKPNPPAKKTPISTTKNPAKVVAKKLKGGVAHIDTQVPPHGDSHVHIDTPRGPHVDTGGGHVDAHQDVWGVGPHEDFGLPHVDSAVPPHGDTSPHVDTPGGPHVDQTIRPPVIRPPVIKKP